MGWWRLELIGGVALVAAALALPASAAAAEPVFAQYSVRTVDGARINVEVMRPPDGEPDAPVILTTRPYNTLVGDQRRRTSPTTTSDSATCEQGYVRAVADVLGTRDSSGCWDYGGGGRDSLSGVDLVNFLAGSAVVERAELR